MAYAVAKLHARHLGNFCRGHWEIAAQYLTPLVLRIAQGRDLHLKHLEEKIVEAERERLRIEDEMQNEANPDRLQFSLLFYENNQNHRLKLYKQHLEKTDSILVMLVCAVASFFGTSFSVIYQVFDHGWFRRSLDQIFHGHDHEDKAWPSVASIVDEDVVLAQVPDAGRIKNARARGVETASACPNGESTNTKTASTELAVMRIMNADVLTKEVVRAEVLNVEVLARETMTADFVQSLGSLHAEIERINADLHKFHTELWQGQITAVVTVLLVTLLRMSKAEHNNGE